MISLIGISYYPDIWLSSLKGLAFLTIEEGIILPSLHRNMLSLAYTLTPQSLTYFHT
jgi:hypothetical protein